MLVLLQDAHKVPGIFFPFGAIPVADLQEWLQRTGLVLPSDLIEFWQLTGGGDVFDSETIFRPTVPSAPNSCFVGDAIERRNAAHADDGKSDDLYIFQDGLFLSAVRLSDQTFVTLTSSGYVIKDCFRTFDQWYVGTLRAEFGEQYGLSALTAR